MYILKFISFAQRQTTQMGAIYGLIKRGADRKERSLEDELKLQWSVFPDIEV